MNVNFRGQCVGDFYADIIVEDTVLLEMKAVKAIEPEHIAQILNYSKAVLVAAGGQVVALDRPPLKYNKESLISNWFTAGRKNIDVAFDGVKKVSQTWD